MSTIPKRNVGDFLDRRAYSIRRRLLILAAVSIVPAALAGTLLLAYAYSKERAAAAAQMQATTRALSIVVDRQLGQAEAMLSALATAPSLLNGDFDAFDSQARQADRIDGSWIVVRDKAGNQLVNTRLPRGASLPHDTGVDAQISKLAAGAPHISNLIQTSAIGKPVIGIDLPISRDGAVQYDLGIVLRPSAFDQVFADQRLPDRWIGAIIDREGSLVRRSRDADNTTGHPISPQLRKQLSAGVTDGLLESTSLEGMPTIAAFSQSPTSGWVFAVAAPSGALGAAARQSLYLGVAIGLGLIALSVLLARRIAGGIARPIEGLVEIAGTLGRGELVLETPTGLAEADLVAAALRDAGTSIRGFTDTLEGRVADRTRDLASANRKLSSEMDERRRAEDQLARCSGWRPWASYRAASLMTSTIFCRR